MWTNKLAGEIFEAFKVYLREYQNMSDEQIEKEVNRLYHCHELVVSNR